MEEEFISYTEVIRRRIKNATSIDMQLLSDYYELLLYTRDEKLIPFIYGTALVIAHKQKGSL